MSRLGRVITLLNSHSRDGSLIGGICATAVEMLAAEGAGLALLNTDRSSAVCVHGAVAEVGEDLQFTLGEGPCRDAFAGDVLVEATRLFSDPRWPMFAAGMADTGAMSVASFPVRIGGARIGALTVYRAATGRLSAEQAADGYVLAQVAAHVIVAAQGDVGSQKLIEEMETGFSRMEPVHQATGMIMGQLGISADEALMRLRSAAFSGGQTIIEIARDVIEGQVVLSGGDGLGT